MNKKRAELPGSRTYRLKTMAELLADGWTVRLPAPGKAYRLLTKEGRVPIREDDWPRLGLPIKLTYHPGKGYMDAGLREWSKYAVEDAAPTQATPHFEPCTCDIRQLMDVGCKCGGFQRERTAAASAVGRRA